MFIEFPSNIFNIPGHVDVNFMEILWNINGIAYSMNFYGKYIPRNVYRIFVEYL